MTTPSLEQARREILKAADEQAFWDEHAEELLASYRDRFVAARNGKIVASDRDLSTLMLLLNSQGIDIRDTWLRYITEDHSKLLL